MRILVTGATGVIGRRTIPLMLEAGHDVTAAGRDPEKLRPLERLGARAQTVDLFDAEAVRRVVDGAEVICNLATAVPPAGARMFLRSAWRGMDRVRCEVSRNLVDAALAGAMTTRLIQESFAPMYEDAGNAWVTEESRSVPQPIIARRWTPRRRRSGSPTRGVRAWCCDSACSTAPTILPPTC